MSLFEELLSKYELNSNSDVINATRELMQEIALAGLYRGGFFEKAAFYGGTCLRIFHKLDRFSEDMDFSLFESRPDFSLEPYFDSIINEFNSLGLSVEISSKEKKISTPIESAFLKQTTPIYNISLKSNKAVKIKFEVDTDPPLGFSTENKLLLQPFSFFVRTFTLPDLFAGKMHALLFRKWKKRVKGRDWYDFEWYVRNGIELNLSHFAKRAFQSKNIKNETIEYNIFYKMLKEKISQMDFELAKEDITNFIKDSSVLKIWSADYFIQLCDHIKIKES